MPVPYPHIFIIPFYRSNPRDDQYLLDTIASLQRQTDPSWHAVIVLDGPRSQLPTTISAVVAADGRITVLTMPHKVGTGACRNTGVTWAVNHSADIILFQDADDLAHPERLALTRAALADPHVDFVYSSFDVIDEDGAPIPTTAITPSIAEILDWHHRAPITGPDAWIPIGTSSGYTTQTSTVAVTSALATRCRFPSVAVSEDSHTWYRMSATGTGFGYIHTKLANYRMNRSTGQGTTQQRLGETFFWIKSKVDLDGFSRALAIAIDRGTLTHNKSAPLLHDFYHRLATTIESEGHRELAECLRGLAVAC